MTPALIMRLKDRAPSLRGRVYGATDLAALMKADQVPYVTPCAHILPTGLLGRADARSVTGAYVQSIDFGFAVVLSLRAADPLGERMALDEVVPLLLEIAKALTGWSPTDQTVGVFAFRRAVLASFVRGVAIYELTFSLPDQLRISP